MSVCATCLKPGLPADGQHDCPGLGDIQLTRQLGRGIRVDTAPPRARMALTVFADHGHGLAMQGADHINIADQVLYQVVGYDAESAALVLELVEDWRSDPAAKVRALSERELHATIRKMARIDPAWFRSTTQAMDRIDGAANTRPVPGGTACTPIPTETLMQMSEVPAGLLTEQQRSDLTEDQLRRTRIELEHWQSVIVPELRDERDAARTALREALGRLLPVHASGKVIGYEPPLPIEAAAVDRWRAALDEQDSEMPPPGFVPVRSVARSWGKPSSDPLVVEPYRNDRGESAWAFRCWGTATCDGWLSLDHYSQESAERARDRHVAEEHGAVAPAATESGTCTATLADPVHTDGDILRCIAPAGHYDETRQPEYPEGGEADPRGWHHTEPDGHRGRTVWSDWADGATPHEGAAVSGYPTPEMRKKMEGVKPGTPPSGPAGASSANGKPTPAPEGS